MSSYLLVCTRCKKKFENQRALTQHQHKLTICKANKMPNVSYDLASEDAPAPTALLAFARVDLAKRRSEMAKSNARKANLPLISAKTGQKQRLTFQLLMPLWINFHAATAIQRTILSLLHQTMKVMMSKQPRLLCLKRGELLT